MVGRRVPHLLYGMNINRLLAVVAFRLTHKDESPSAAWRQESTQPKDAYMLISEYCWMAALPASVLSAFAIVPAMDALGFDHLWARIPVYGFAVSPLICALFAYIECIVRASRESSEFDHAWTRPEYFIPRRVDFLSNPAALVTSSVVGIAVSAALGICLSVWNPMALGAQ